MRQHSRTPPYRVPVTPEPTPSYRETGPWTPAAPSDAAPRGRWWAVIQDPELDDLEGRLESENPGLAAALARYEQSKALATRARLCSSIHTSASKRPPADATSTTPKPTRSVKRSR